jgi:hypothetical protein
MKLIFWRGSMAQKTARFWQMQSKKTSIDDTPYTKTQQSLESFK